MLFRNRKLIRVEFYHAETRAVVGYDEIPLKRIPEDFDRPTQVDVDGVRWNVAAIDPAVRKEIRKAGEMKVWVLPVAGAAEGGNISANARGDERAAEANEDIVGSLSATADRDDEGAREEKAGWHRNASHALVQPRFSGKRGDMRLLELSPWEWRQREFVSREFVPEVGEEFAHIERVRAAAAVQTPEGTFYSGQHARELIVVPLRGIELTEVRLVEDHFPFANRYEGATMMGHPGYVDSGFAFMLPGGLAFYGQEVEGRIRYLALAESAVYPVLLAEDLPRLSVFMARYGLVLVDWDRLEAVEAEMGQLRAYFGVD